MWRAVCTTGAALLRVPAGAPSQAQAFRRFSSMTHKQVRALSLGDTTNMRPWVQRLARELRPVICDHACSQAVAAQSSILAKLSEADHLEALQNLR